MAGGVTPAVGVRRATRFGSTLVVGLAVLDTISLQRRRCLSGLAVALPSQGAALARRCALEHHILLGDRSACGVAVASVVRAACHAVPWVLAECGRS